MKTGLLFGSFNPVHVGHLAIAEYFISHTDIEKVWFIVSPLNPLKNCEVLMDENHRLNMVKLAIMDNPGFEACDMEFNLPKPSFTIDTLKALEKNHPDRQFVLLIGTDSLIQFDQWKDYTEILQKYKLYIYPRKTETRKPGLPYQENIHFFDAPELDISSSYIRECIKNKQSIRYLTPLAVINYLGTLKKNM
jgi:nicotinate-nucleotide adenylyltransferase